MISDWLGIPAAIVAWSFALYVLVVAPPARGAHFLVAMLFADGLAWSFAAANDSAVCWTA